mmetsp:Transcript_44949/g.83897  ORF Transcript_44949/g.83897 Transcript_44949/m.83897 type:complete len:420 (+) Transcript_44949:50-1309(+)
MASDALPLGQASADLDFVARADLEDVLSGPVPENVKKLFQAIMKVFIPELPADTWEDIQDCFREDTGFISNLQRFALELEENDKHRIRDVLHSELEITRLPTDLVAAFSSACVLLLRWCHSLGCECGCPPPSSPVTEEHRLAARQDAQAARGLRAAEAQRLKDQAREEKRLVTQITGEGSKEEAGETGGGSLAMRSLLSGVVITLHGAQPYWSYRQLTLALRESLPEWAGDIHLFHGNEPVDIYNDTLESLGIDTQGEGELDYRVDSIDGFVEAESTKVITGDSKEEILRNVQFVLEKANGEINCLSKSDISELKALVKPPLEIFMVFEAVGILMEKPVDGWKALRSMVAHPDFLDSLRTFGMFDVSPEALAKVKWYIYHPRLSPDRLNKISRAALGMWTWVQAVNIASLASHKLKSMA